MQYQAHAANTHGGGIAIVQAEHTRRQAKTLRQRFNGRP
jgi:hypothetical protein